MSESKSNKAWFVYMLRCMGDETIYTGITTDVYKRLKQHEAGKGAKYTRGRGPFIVLYFWFKSSKSDALKHEIELKNKSREEKIELVDYWLGIKRDGEDTEQTRYHPFGLIGTLKENGWSTENIVDKSNPSNNSTYIIWTKNDKTVYVGNYYLQSEGGGVLAWKDHDIREEDIIKFLNESEGVSIKGE